MINDLVSVVIPTYNREKELEVSVKSVLHQTYDNLEVIVIDDCSTDNTEEMLSKINDGRVTYIRNEQNMGPAVSRNRGARLAKGEFIAFHDSDDEWYPDKLSKQMKVFAKHPDYSLVYCAYKYSYPDREIQIPGIDTDKKLLSGKMFESLLNENKIGTPTIVVRKDAFFEVDGFDEELRSLEDWEFAIRISENHLIGYVDEILMKANYSEGSVNDEVKNAGFMAETCTKILCRYYGAYPTSKLERVLKETFASLSYLPEEEIERYKGILTNKGLLDDTFFNLILEERRRTMRFKEKYQVALKLSPESDFANKVQEYLHKYECNRIYVYGYGLIGKRILSILKSRGISVDGIIDKNVLEADIQIYRPDDLNGISGLVIVSVPDTENNIKNKGSPY